MCFHPTSTLFLTVKAISSPVHTTPASLLWLQYAVFNSLRHWERELSVPEHLAWCKIGPLCCPKQASRGALTAFPHFSCLHTTWASSRSQWSPHIVPLVPFWISTLPLQLFGPSQSFRVWASVHGYVTYNVETCNHSIDEMDRLASIIRHFPFFSWYFPW